MKPKELPMSKTFRPYFLPGDHNNPNDPIRTLQIAAAGKHPILVLNPTACPVQALAKQIVKMLPDFSKREIKELIQIYTSPNEIPHKRPVVTITPDVHHGSLIGGGRLPEPGLLSIAHTGILILKDINQFQEPTLATIRDVLKEGEVTLSRANQIRHIPAAPILLATISDSALNPASTFPHFSLVQNQPQTEHFSNLDKGKYAVAKAREIQLKRYGNTITTNANMKPEQLATHCQLRPQQLKLLMRTAQNGNNPKKDFDKQIWLARTIADLAGCPTIEADHLREAMRGYFLYLHLVGQP